MTQCTQEDGRCGQRLECDQLHGQQYDKIAPVTVTSVNPATPNGSNGWYTSDVTVSLSEHHNLSGVAKTEYQVNGGDWITYTGSIPAFGDGVYKVGYRSTDLVGNVEQTQTIEFKVDVFRQSLLEMNTSEFAGSDAFHLQKYFVEIADARITGIYRDLFDLNM